MTGFLPPLFPRLLRPLGLRSPIPFATICVKPIHYNFNQLGRFVLLLLPKYRPLSGWQNPG